ncbi:MAG: hypothetical protein WCG05_01385 [Alphaproteobacteria bacterium]
MIRTVSFFSLMLLFISTYGAPSESIIKNWANEEYMRPYYGTISEFRKLIEQASPKSKNGFINHPTPDFDNFRSPKYLFLEIAKGDYITGFFTPFGKITLMPSGALDDWIEYTQKIMSQAANQWELVDVTSHVKWYEFSGGKDGESMQKPVTLKQKSAKLFLIKSFKGHQFIKSPDKEFLLFSSVSLSDECSEKDTALFHKLSSGRNCF